MQATLTYKILEMNIFIFKIIQKYNVGLSTFTKR